METDAGPLIPRDRLLVGVTDAIEHELRCAMEYALGVEVETFAYPEILAGDFEPLLKRFKKRISSISGEIGFHGAFFDTCHFSLDPEIRHVARKRYLQSMDIAERLCARFVVFHSQYNPVVRVPAYPEIYHAGSLAFWADMLEEARRRNLAIYLENMFDDTPGPLCRLLDDINDTGFKSCLDVAHVAIFSKVDCGEWIKVLRPHLRHIHLNDCNGDQDEHLGLGQGALDILRIVSLLKKTGRNLTYTLETGAQTARSLRYLRLNKPRH